MTSGIRPGFVAGEVGVYMPGPANHTHLRARRHGTIVVVLGHPLVHSTVQTLITILRHQGDQNRGRSFATSAGWGSEEECRINE